nr:DUF6531 domain-containing protein [Ferriphaselus amnicola]
MTSSWGAGYPAPPPSFFTCDGGVVFNQPAGWPDWDPTIQGHTNYWWRYYFNGVGPYPLYSIGYDPAIFPIAKNFSASTHSCTTAPAEAAAPVHVGNPIHVGIGDKLQVEVDYAQANGLEFVRYYHSSMFASKGGFGQQWRHTYDRKINSLTSGGYSFAYVTRADGKQFSYQLSSGTWIPDADINDTLVRLTDASGNTTGWKFTDEVRKQVETYDASGKLSAIIDRNGVALALSYSDATTPISVAPAPGLLIRIADAYGRQISLTYDMSSRVSTMTDPASRVYNYSYDANNNLIGVVYPDDTLSNTADNPKRIYLYGETTRINGGASCANNVDGYPHALTGMLDTVASDLTGDPNKRFGSWEYDCQGRAIASEHGSNMSGGAVDRYQVSYGASSAVVTDPLLSQRTYNLQTVLGVVKSSGQSQPAGSGCSAAAANLNYDTNGNIASRTDFNGNLTCYSYDLTRNLESVRVEGLPSGSACPTNLATYTPVAGSVERKTTTQWHASYRLPTAIAEPLRITSFSYDTKGNLLGRTVQGTTDATGATGMAATASGTARITTYTYNAAGQILTENGPRTDVQDVTQYTYDTQSNLATVKNALNRITTLGGYDANGRPATITDPNGLITSLGYDARGRLLTRNVGGETTGYTYDGVGNLTGVTLPNGASYTYTYDAAHRLTRITDALGNQLVYILDNAGNRTQEQLFDSTGTLIKKHSRIFDALSRLQQDIGAVNQTTTYTYDANGNLTGVTDPLNRQTTNVYDALNRLSQVSNPDTGVVKYAYDGLDQLKQVTDPRNLVTTYTRDGLSNLSQTVSPDTGTTNVTYDAAGNVLTSTDAKGQKATYTYDALNRVLTISYSGGTSPAQSVTYQYDQGVNGLGHLTSMTDITGTTSFSYDAHGRLLTETKVAYAATYVTRYSYDVQGKLTSMTYPSGRLVSYSYDTIGRVSQVSTTLSGQTQVLVSGITYHPFGGVKSMLRGNGKTYTRLVDQDGRIASYTVNGKSMSIGYNPASEIALITDSTNPTLAASYSYDPMSRLTNYTQGSISQGFVYDKVGNRTSQTVGATSTTYGYAATSNRLASTQVGAAAAKTVTQDVNGATTSDGVKQYAYDIRGRMSQATTAQGTVNYFVNALGLRTRKQATFTTTDTVYLYDTDAHLIGEFTTGTIKPAREYVWLGDMPVAVMQ